MALVQRSDLTNITLSPGTTGGSNIIHPQFASDIINSAVQYSRALQMFPKRRVPTGTLSIPVLSALPSAYWVENGPFPGASGDATYKQTTSQAWKGVQLRLSELAAIVAIPLADLHDAAGSGTDLFAEIEPRVGEAIGLELDKAVFFGDAGTTSPANFADGLVPQAIAAGHTHDLSAAVLADADNTTVLYDLANDALSDVEVAGFDPMIWFAGRGFKGQLRGIKDADGRPVFTTSIRDDKRTSEFVDTPIEFMPAGSWNASTALALTGDPSTVMLGYSLEGMQIDMLKEATLDVGGGDTINLAQQNMVALRVSVRWAYATAQPVTAAGDNGFAWSVVVP